jgi:hypothetical protein
MIPRSPVWFVIVVLLLTVAAWPAIAQTEEAEPGCPDLLPSRLIVAERGRVSRDDPAPVNVRAEPGTDGEQIGQIPVGVVFFVLEGPECTQRYTWYRVKAVVEGTGLTGWIAEGDARSWFVERFPPGM